ncbi:MAG: dephospho-CoA kinase [Prolixibacteraceae bacterium]|nr:dephospho-CoA kinase [Prolixibacteraceae bacterium]
MGIKIGITGGIGSGKSVVCKIFKCLGIPVFEADNVGKFLLDNDKNIRKKITGLFGESVYMPDNSIDRKKLASIIFNDNIALQKVNEIIHPAVRKEFESWILKQNTIYMIHEAAILFESGFYKLMDFNIHISADKNIRIKRVMERNKISEEMVLTRLNKQWDDKKKEKLADAVIYNNNELLIPQVLKIDKQLKENGKIC